MGAQFAGQGADGLAHAAFANLLVLDPLGADTPGRILALFVLTLVPYSLIAPFTGVFVDRWNRRNIMVGTNLIRAALLLLVPLWSRLPGGDAPMYAAVLVLMGFGRLFLTTKGAVLPVVLDEHQLIKGNSLSTAGGSISALIGGVAGLGLAGGLGTHSTLVLAGCAYAAPALVARRIARPLSPSHAGPRPLGRALKVLSIDLVAGARQIRATAPARFAMIATFLLRSIGMFMAVAVLIAIKNEFPGDDDRFGRLGLSAVALAAAGIGALVGAVVAPYVGRRMSKPRVIVFGYVIAGAGLLLFGWIGGVTPVLLLTATGGMGGFITKVGADALIQESLPDQVRGRAFALYDILYNMASVAGGIAIVIFQDAALRTQLPVAGAVTMVVALALTSAMHRSGLLLPAGAD